MNQRSLAVVAFTLFTVYSLIVAATHGLDGLIAVHAQGGWAYQILIDLVIAAGSFWIVGIPDARARGIRVWPYVALTPLLGSIAILAYFVRRSLGATRR